MARVRVASAVALCALLVTAGAPLGTASGGAVEHAGHGGGAESDPPSDRVGWEAGYWHDESIDVDQSDGLSDRELDAFVARSMARVEFLRDAEFEREVPVEVISRAEYRSNRSDSTNASFAAWNNQVWEALFVDGENSNVQDRLRSTIGSAVVGFYSPDDDEIKIITSTPDEPRVDNATLIHELVHALQDQRGLLTAAREHGGTQDADLAVDAVVEGEANFIERRYERRCGAEWECVAGVSSDGSGGGDRNLGILLTVLQPYSDGPVYVRSLVERNGWSAVEKRFEDPPASTEQVIHLTDETPTPIAFEDRARNGWRLYPDHGENGSDTAGEASMFVMFWYQARTAGANTVSPSVLGRTSSALDMYNYDARPSAGWGNDRVFPYRNNGTEEGGYVWVTEWDTSADARQFRRAHRAILRAQGAVERDGTLVVEDGPFADAFRVDRSGTRVTIVNGPTPAAVEDIRPATGAAGNGSGASSGGESGGRAPGFGVVGALVALLAVGALARRSG